jgi:hypothetical protein
VGRGERRKGINMAQEHDSWLEEMGLDVSILEKVRGSSVTGTQFRGKTPEGAEVELLSGQGEVREDGTVTGKGSVLKFADGDESGELLSGEFQAGEDGVSGKGAIAKVDRGNGTTDTLGEVEFSSQKASVAGFKRETDISKATGVLPPNIVAKADVGVGTASLDSSFNQDGISIGAQANVAEGSVTLGTSGTKREDGSDSDEDQTFRFGLSEGVGLAGRVHFGDADQDHNPEFGVGADFGPVSFDVKTEDPLRTGAALISPNASLAGQILDDNPSNLTKDVMQATVGATPEDGLNAGRGLVASAKEAVAGAEEQVAGGVRDLVGGLTDLVTGGDD